MPRREPGPDVTPAPLPTAGLDEPERIACLRLIRSDNVGPVTFRELIGHYGTAATALEALPELAHRGGRMRAARIYSKSAAEAELDARAAWAPSRSLRSRKVILGHSPPPTRRRR